MTDVNADTEERPASSPQAAGANQANGCRASRPDGRGGPESGPGRRGETLAAEPDYRRRRADPAALLGGRGGGGRARVAQLARQPRAGGDDARPGRPSGRAARYRPAQSGNRRPWLRAQCPALLPGAVHERHGRREGRDRQPAAGGRPAARRCPGRPRERDRAGTFLAHPLRGTGHRRGPRQRQAGGQSRRHRGQGGVRRPARPDRHARDGYLGGQGASGRGPERLGGGAGRRVHRDRGRPGGHRGGARARAAGDGDQAAAPAGRGGPPGGRRRLRARGQAERSAGSDQPGRGREHHARAHLAGAGRVADREYRAAGACRGAGALELRARAVRLHRVA